MNINEYKERLQKLQWLYLQFYYNLIQQQQQQQLAMIIQSLVDYVLERGNKDYGEFASRKQTIDPSSAVFNQRKMLEYLFKDTDPEQQIGDKQQFYKKISDMKIEQISGQLNYFSQKMHAQFSRKYLNLDADLYKLQNQWLRKKIPDFYCYYFLKFSYANSYSRMHQLILSEIQNMAREKDSYWIIRKTIQAREVCIINVRKQLTNLTDLDIEQGLATIKEENQLKKKLLRQQGKNMEGFKSKNQVGQETGKSWKNKLELAFQSLSHLRKLSCYVVQLIKNWKSSIYNISQDPRRYRQRVIFYHHEANYLLKMLFDSDFIKDTVLKKNFKFATHYDPFIIKPIMILQNKQNKTYNQTIFMQLIKPSEAQMSKIVKSLIILAEQQYDQDQQSRFINERKNYGELQTRKRMIQKKRDSLGIGHRQSSSKKIIPPQQKESPIKKPTFFVQQKDKKVQFASDKKSSNLQNQIEQVKGEKLQQAKKTAIMASLTRAKKIRPVDLKKVSPYLSRNEHLKKAQQVIQMQHKFKVAHGEYLQTLKRNKSTTHFQNKNKQKSKVQQISEIVAKNKDLADNKIFNKYIEENIRLMDQAKRKDYLYKNEVTTSPLRKKIQSSISYNKISFQDRKQAEYQRNLQRYYHQNPQTTSQKNIQSPSKPKFNYGFPYQKKGTKPIIEISDRGIKSGQKIIQFQLSGKKGKNVSGILQTQQRLQLSRTVQQKLSSNPPIQKNQQNSPGKNSNQQKNLFESEQRQQIIVLRQQPQKIQQIKRTLYQQIKSELMEELKREAGEKQKNLNDMIEQEKIRKLNQIMEERRKEQERRKVQQERMRLAQLEKQRKKINIQIKIQDIQYAEQNSHLWFDKVFECNKEIFQRLFTNESSEKIKITMQNQLHCVFLRGFHQQNQIAYCMVHYDWKQETSRRLIISYLATKQTYFYISTFHNICQFLWKKDPVDEIEIIMFNNDENAQGKKVIADIHEYASRNGEAYQKRLYSNIVQMRYVVFRPSHYKDLEFKFNKFYFGKKLNFKSQLLQSAVSLAQRHQPLIDMNLEVFTNYIFLLEQLFRSYLTPEEIVQLRQNSTNIRRLKDIFRIVLELEKSPPSVDQLTIVQGLNLSDLYDKLKSKVQPPYDAYFWSHFYDKTPDNRILLAILKTKLEIPYSLNSAKLNDRNYLRINTKSKILTLRSSVYSKQQIYILNTDNPKIRIFLMQGQSYKLMRIQLFIFLNLVFNNIVQDSQKFINSIWMPQFAVNQQGGQKMVKRITDFSISMKKNFYLSQQIYFCNNQYIRSGLSLLPKGSDIIFRQSMIFGMLHTQVQRGSTGMPIYGKLIDKKQYF